MLTFSPSLPVREPDNAGTRYVRDVLDALPPQLEPTVVVPDGPSVQRSIAAQPTVPYRVLESPPAARAEIVRRSRALLSLQAPRGFAWHLEHSEDLRQRVATAEVIDLQWIEQAMLIGRLRAINPRAHIVTTVHDVLSQRFGRQVDAATDPLRKARWRWAEFQARRLERAVTDTSDTVVVLSEKDRRLMPSGTATVVTVVPPLADSRTTIERDPQADTILFVGYLARWENEQGILWFLDKVLPRVRAQRPDVRMVIAGGGLRDTVIEAAGRADAELLGFVEDLTPLYRTASVSVIPLQLGAGVKFKTVDSLAASVPVVTTRVGAEGIGESRPDGGNGLFHAVADDPASFAQGILDVLRAPKRAERLAIEAQHWVRGAYGHEQFQQTMHEVYGRRRSL